MLFVISGAAASGKKTIAKAVAERLPGLESHHDNERPSRDGAERLTNLDHWIEDALNLEAGGTALILATQSPIGEVLAAPRSIELEGIAPLLLDCHDFVRADRIVRRGELEEWPFTIDHLCWAAYHRMHARDPQWENRISTAMKPDGPRWDRWLDWSADDPRWCVRIHDSTTEDVETTTRAVASWVESVRTDGTPLSRRSRWWELRG